MYDFSAMMKEFVGNGHRVPKHWKKEAIVVFVNYYFGREV